MGVGFVAIRAGSVVDWIAQGLFLRQHDDLSEVSIRGRSGAGHDSHIKRKTSSGGE